VRAASATFSSGRLPIVNFTSLQCYGLILVIKTLKKRFPNIDAASAVLAKYEAFNNHPMTGYNQYWIKIQAHFQRKHGSFTDSYLA